MNRKFLVVILLSLSTLGALGLKFSYARHEPSVDRLLLLVPDGSDFSDPKVTAWTNAGSEEGLNIVPVHDSDFLRPFFSTSQCAGLIFPDSIHKKASDLVVASLKQFVAQGGKLMLVYDAATLTDDGRYPFGSSRLSDVVGVKYALYDQLGDKAIQWSKLKTTNQIIREFDVPPGKYYPIRATSSETPAANQTVTASAADSGFDVQLRRYKFGDLEYPNFVTEGNYSGNALFHSNAGLVAGTHSYGQGMVLFVNLPLGYLKTRTDALPLHIFLKYFATQILSLPYLMPVPDGVGGLVLNWHVDSNAAVEPLQELESWSLLQQGPYSVHITAGPDTVNIGDKLGVDAEHNPIIKEFIHKYMKLGYAIGSHGGWIHNYFSAHIETDSPEYMQQFLMLNKTALEKVSGQPVIEYSAPNGDQPIWVTHWLEAHGFIAYYFTGDSGMGPTQVYRDGQRSGQRIWAFPILHLDRAAAFEEFPVEGYSDAEVQDWLESVTSFVSQHSVIRLVYFHPPGIIRYRPVIDQWMTQTAQLKAAGQFRWYTMSDIAHFLNSRKDVHWTMSQSGQNIIINARHPESLLHFTWSLPMDRFAQPQLTSGEGTVFQSGNKWMVVAGDVKTLQILARIAP